MTGNLTINSNTPRLLLDKTAVTQYVTIRGLAVGKTRWDLNLGNNQSESGSNVGTDFEIYRYNDAGTFLGVPMEIRRSNGQILTETPVLPRTSAWTAAQQLAARQSVYAAPLDALAYCGMQVNGGFDIWQEFPSGNNGVTGQGYAADLYSFVRSVANNVGTVNLTRPGATGLGLPYCLSIKATTAITSIVSNDVVVLQQGIEGYRTSRLNWGSPLVVARPLTIAFWMWSTVTGTVSVAIRNSGVSRSYVTTISVSAAWGYYKLTIPPDVSGTWLADNGVGLYIAFTFGAGATRTASAANTWLAGDFLAAPGQTNTFFTTVNNEIYIAGLFAVAGVGDFPTTAEQLALMQRDRANELNLMQRYLEIGGYGTSGMWENGMQCQLGWYYRVKKRATPTVTLTSTTPIVTEVGYADRTGSASALTAASAGTIGGYRAIVNGFTGPVNGRGALMLGDYLKSDARM